MRMIVWLFLHGVMQPGKESALNTRTKSLSMSSKEDEERDALCKRVVRRLSSI